MTDEMNILIVDSGAREVGVLQGCELGLEPKTYRLVVFQGERINHILDTLEEVGGVPDVLCVETRHLPPVYADEIQNVVTKAGGKELLTATVTFNTGVWCFYLYRPGAAQRVLGKLIKAAIDWEVGRITAKQGR